MYSLKSKKLKSVLALLLCVVSLSFVFQTVSFAQSLEDSIAIDSFYVVNREPNSITLGFECAGEVSGFKLYKYVKSTKKTTLLDTISPNKTTYTVGNLLSGTDYCFKIKSYSKASGKTVTSETVTLNTYTTLPKITGLKLYENNDTSRTLTWNAVPGVSNYRIYYLNKTKNEYVFLGSKSTNSATIKSLSPCKPYTYKVRACASVQNKTKTIYGPYSTRIDTLTAPSKVEKFNYSALTSTSVKLSWSECKNITGYKIYRYNSETVQYELVKTVKSGTKSCKIADLKPAKSYKFKVRTYFKSSEGLVSYGAYSPSIFVTTKPESVTLMQMTNDPINDSIVRISWTKSKNCSGYLIYVSDHMNSGFSLFKTISNQSTLSTTLSISNGVRKYIKIKPYVSINGVKTYGDYSKVITVYA